MARSDLAAIRGQDQGCFRRPANNDDPLRLAGFAEAHLVPIHPGLSSLLCPWEF